MEKFEEKLQYLIKNLCSFRRKVLSFFKLLMANFGLFNFSNLATLLLMSTWGQFHQQFMYSASFYTYRSQSAKRYCWLDWILMLWDRVKGLHKHKHQHSTSSFCTPRFRKRKKTYNLTVFFPLWDLHVSCWWNWPLVSPSRARLRCSLLLSFARSFFRDIPLRCDVSMNTSTTSSSLLLLLMMLLLATITHMSNFFCLSSFFKSLWLRTKKHTNKNNNIHKQLQLSGWFNAKLKFWTKKLSQFKHVIKMVYYTLGMIIICISIIIN